MTTTTLSDMPQGCGCAACQATSAEAVSSTYTGTATATLSEGTSLYSGYRWGAGTSGTVLTYKFFTALPGYYSTSSTESHNFQSFNSQMVAATERILTQIENFTNITFVETTSSTTQLGFAQATLTSGVGAWAYYPSSNSLGGDIWTNNMYSSTQNPVEGNYAFYTLMHEIGHALGLQHSFTAGLTGDEASSRYSVMAYDWSPFFASSYMVYDIAALQKIYGANMNYATGDNIYVTNSSLAYTIWDAGGNDTLDASAQTSSVTLDLREGEYSTVGLIRNIGIAYGAVIENAIGGSGNDILIGNSANNILTGNAGNDTFVASSGDDSVDGGNGTDLLVFDSALSDFIFGLIDSVTIMVQNLYGAYGSTTASNIENFEFAGTAYDFSTLASVSSAGPVEILNEISINVFSSYKWKGSLKKFWTEIDSSLEASMNYQASDFRYRFTDDILTVGRSNDSGRDTLTLTALAGYEDYLKIVSLTDIGATEVIEFNNIYNVNLIERDATQDMNVIVDGGYGLSLVTGLGNDVIDILSSSTGKQKVSYSIDAGSGNDTISIEGGSSKMSASISAGDGDDRISITMNAGAQVNAGNGNDILNGGIGGDVLNGGSGNDLIHGNSGDDSLIGGDGDDLLYGGIGSDTLTGGLGIDTFVIDRAISGERDAIKDFNASEDIIDISAVISGYDPLTDQINEFITTSYNRNKKATYLLVDTDGADGSAGWIAVAQVNGLRGQDIDDLVQNGHLVVA